MSNSLSMSWFLLIIIHCLGASEYYEPELIIVWVCWLLIAKSFIVLKYISSTNQRWHRQMSCAFEYGIDLLKQICSHMSPTFPLIETLYICTQHLLGDLSNHSVAFGLKMLLVHLFCVWVSGKYSINLIPYEIWFKVKFNEEIKYYRFSPACISGFFKCAI